MHLYHGTDSDFETFDPARRATAEHIYTTPDQEAATVFGKNILEFDGDLGRAFDMRLDHIFGDICIEEYAVLRDIYADIGYDWGFENFEAFLLVTTAGEMYQYGSGQSFQNAVLREVFSRGYNSVKITDAGCQGSFFDGVVFEDPFRLKRINN